VHNPLSGTALLCFLVLAAPAHATDDQPPPTDDLQRPAYDERRLESDAAAREALQLDVRAYLRSIEALEEREGAFAPGLSEQLLGLGLALQRNGEHEQAIEVFKRGVHLARINEGLYSRRQLSLLQGEIASHVALGAFSLADERQRYLYRVQARTLSDTSRGQALMEHALWQRQAYEAGLSEEPYARLMRMWSLYRLALSEFVKAEGETSPELLPPLYGMLRAQYLLSGFVGETTSGRFRTRGIFGDEESMQVAYRDESFKQGTAVIRAIYDVRLAQEDASSMDTIDSTLMLGDWQLWHNKRNEAFATYGELYEELDANDAAKALREEIFGTPRPLPNIAGIRAIPEPVDERPGRLLLEFGVTDRGRVVDIERLDDNPQNDAEADNVIRRLRATLFRPRLSDGLPVDTEGLRWAYDLSMW
jgi:tetratricopeptide (TPR) repeat protein